LVSVLKNAFNLYAVFPGNELAGLLAKTGAALPFASGHSPLCYLEAKSFSQFFLVPDFFGFLRRVGLSSPRPLCTVPTSLPWSQAFVCPLIYAG